MNLCEKEIIDNIQQTNEQKNYNFDSIAGIMNIGNFRKHQEDSMLLTSKNNEEDIQMAVIADGMGGIKCGAYASWLAVMETYKWFQYLDIKALYNSKQLLVLYKKFLNELDEKIRFCCNGGGTTMVSVMSIKDKFLITNIGDSRAYLPSTDNFKQITIDHSITQQLLLEKKILNSNVARFHKKNNLILSRLGCDKKLLEIDFFEIDFNKAEQIFLFSDGVTDCVSNDRLKEIYLNSFGFETCKKFINEALTIDSFYDNNNNDEYYNYIQAGKDNLSCAYIKQRRNNEKIK